MCLGIHVYSSFLDNGPVKNITRNIKVTKEFVVNVISEPWAAQANDICCVDALPGISE